MPDKPTAKTSMTDALAMGIRNTIMDASSAQTFDPNQNAFEIKKSELLQEIKDLNEHKIKLE